MNNEITNQNKPKNNLRFIITWVATSIALASIGFAFVIIGVVTGISTGYGNHNSTFSFEPYAIGLFSFIGIDIIFNIIMAIVAVIRKKNN